MDKIANAITESGLYSKERPTGVSDDWNIFKNPLYKLSQINKMSVIINTVIGILTFLALLASVIITQKSSKAQQLFKQKVEHQLEILSNKNAETNSLNDSLTINNLSNQLTK